MVPSRVPSRGFETDWAAQHDVVRCLNMRASASLCSQPIAHGALTATVADSTV